MRFEPRVGNRLVCFGYAYVGVGRIPAIGLFGRRILLLGTYSRRV